MVKKEVFEWKKLTETIRLRKKRGEKSLCVIVLESF